MALAEVDHVLVQDQPRLTLRTLGAFTVTRDGVDVQPSAWARRKSRELLWLLCAEHGRAISRERATELLWPDAPRHPPAVRLRVTLHALNDTLEPGRPPRGPTRFVHASTERIHLDPFVWLDTDEFRLRAHRACAEPDSARAVQLSRAALELYRGSFLAEAPYLEWAQPTRDSLQSTYVDLALRAGVVELTHGSASRSAELARSVLALDPYREVAYRLLAQAYLAHGDAAAARAVFATCRHRLIADLGVGPSWTVDGLIPANAG